MKSYKILNITNKLGLLTCGTMIGVLFTKLAQIEQI